MPARTVSRPTAVARTVERAGAVDGGADDPVTDRLLDGSDSPVTIDSSAAEAPATTSPSTGIVLPGADPHDVADLDLVGRDPDLGIADHHRCLPGAEGQ